VAGKTAVVERLGVLGVEADRLAIGSQRGFPLALFAEGVATSNVLLGGQGTGSGCPARAQTREPSSTRPTKPDGLLLCDPTGSIRADLERLGQLEDGAISTVDAGELLAFRLSAAGFESTLDKHPGGHIISNKVAELVGYLVNVVNR
jgi:hypothetical protein